MHADSPNPLQITGSANPSSATSIKLGKTFYDGENVNWTVMNNGACIADKDVLYYSANECNDVPYYVHYTSNTSDSNNNNVNDKDNKDIKDKNNHVVPL